MRHADDPFSLAPDRFVAAAIDRWRGFAATVPSCEVDVDRSPNPRPMLTPRLMSRASDSNAYRPRRRDLTVSGRRSRTSPVCAHRRGPRSGLASELGHRTPVGFRMGPAVLVPSSRESRARVGFSASRRPATCSVTAPQKRTPSDSRARRRWSGGGQHRWANGGKKDNQRGRGVGAAHCRRARCQVAFALASRRAPSSHER